MLFLEFKKEEMWSCGHFWGWDNLFDKGALKKYIQKWKKEEKQMKTFLWKKNIMAWERSEDCVSENAKEQTCAVRGKKSSWRKARENGLFLRCHSSNDCKDLRKLKNISWHQNLGWGTASRVWCSVVWVKEMCAPRQCPLRIWPEGEV